MAYFCFHRTWWRYNPEWPNNREPQAGDPTRIAVVEDEQEAVNICRNWNKLHDPGKYSRKAEYTEIPAGSSLRF